MVSSIMTWNTFISWFIVVLLASIISLWFAGCSTKDNDLKTSQCRLKLDFNCDCKKDSSLLTDVGEEVNKLKD